MNKQQVTENIISAISSNRISTTEVADALGKTNVMPSMSPVTQDLHRVGPIRPVFVAGGTNFGLHDQVRSVQPNEVVVVYTESCGERAIFGDLVAKFVVLYLRATAMVVTGFVRDAARLRREKYPIWCRGYTPLGCFNVPGPSFAPEEEARIRSEVEGGIAVCDDGGVVIIPQHMVTEETLHRLEQIELQEDLWYFCLDVLKWDTKKIVCDRDYLRHPDLLPAVYRNALDRLRVRLDE